MLFADIFLDIPVPAYPLGAWVADVVRFIEVHQSNLGRTQLAFIAEARVFWFLCWEAHRVRRL